MKKSILILLIMSCLHPGITNGQLVLKNKMSGHFVLDGLHLTLSNNYFRNDAYRYQPYYIAIPFKEQYFRVYGSHLVLSVFEQDSLVSLGTFSSSLYLADTSVQDKDFFKLKEIECRVQKNGAQLRDWQLINTLPSFQDTSVKWKADPKKFRTAYWVVNDSLNIGDSVSIEFRKLKDAPFWKIHANRKDAYTQPYLMATAARPDSLQTEAEFIRDRLMHPVIEGTFYDDWPEQGNMSPGQQSPDRRLAFYFRRENNGLTDSVYRYRVLGGKYKDTSWQKTEGLILVTTLQPNAFYKLEVKYADGHGRTSVYTFYTPPLWYQALWFRVLLFAIAVVIGLLIVFTAKAQKGKRRNEIQKLEMQALYAQMNPHFLFNALGSIQGLMNDRQTDKANTYLTGFASLLRSSISQGSKEYVPLNVELKTVENYIGLEQLRFSFQFKLIIADGIMETNMEVPPLLAQPLIENAVKHGISAKGETGLLTLTVEKAAVDLLISITDNGSGFDTTKPASGHGIQLTEKRIALFNRMHTSRKIELEISSSSEGTCCRIRFKKWLTYD